MLVCHCRRVCHRQLLQAIRDGASSVDAIGEACGAGTGCGGCQPVIAEVLLEEQLAEGVVDVQRRTVLPLAPLVA